MFATYDVLPSHVLEREEEGKRDKTKKVGSKIFFMGMMGTDHNNRMTKRHQSKMTFAPS